MLVVEEMTSLSKIFRNVQLGTQTEQAKQIQIKNLSLAQPTDEKDENNREDSFRERERSIANQEGLLAERKQALVEEEAAARARIQAERESWESEKQALQHEAYEEGFTQGVEEGRAKGYAELQETLQQTNMVLNEAYQNAAAYVQEQEQVILELAIRTAERILGEKLEDNPDYFLSVVRRGLKEAREMKEIKLYVSMHYFSLISSNREELAAIFPIDVPFMIFVDEEMNDTDCYIETNRGRIVVSIDEQLKELRRKLVDILESME